MTQFFTNEEVSLEKEINIEINPATSIELIEEIYEIQRCFQWIKSNNFKKVCLQFPDHLLADSSEVSLRLQKQLGEIVYVLADTAYESCCIDYVAAGHVNADAIIHFGPVCFSKTSANIPFLNIYEKGSLDLDSIKQCFSETFPNEEENLIIILDTPFQHLTDQVKMKFPNITVKGIDCDELNLTNTITIFIGGRNHHRKLPNIKFTYKPRKLYYHVEQGPSILNYEQDEKMLRRRYFLIEKIKDSNTIGIVIGTLGVKNYLEAIETIKKLINLHKKKYYIISVGKPTVAKLANFPEMDIYVIVTCALNEIYDSRDFYKPIVTMYDIEMALNPNSDNLGFSYDYNSYISRPIGEVLEESSDVSLLTGAIRGVSNAKIGGELVVKEGGTVALNSTHGAGYLAGRSWKGLERELGKTDVQMVVEGRRGIAQQYNEEIV